MRTLGGENATELEAERLEPKWLEPCMYVCMYVCRGREGGRRERQTDRQTRSDQTRTDLRPEGVNES